MSLFQSLGRDSVHSSLVHRREQRCQFGFQSLGRDSVHSSSPGGVGGGGAFGGFNPSVGILFIQAAYYVLLSVLPDCVSIPRSGFCSFKPIDLMAKQYHCHCFNPSVGILFIQASSPAAPGSRDKKFQSLGRDSVHSSVRWNQGVVESLRMFQSLGRDSVHSSRRRHAPPWVGVEVSIPRSGFCSFKLGFSGFIVPGTGCFNPSVGILFIQAQVYVAILHLYPSFQSLGRDSVHSSQEWKRRRCTTGRFQSLGRDSVHSSPITWE